MHSPQVFAGGVRAGPAEFPARRLDEIKPPQLQLPPRAIGNIFTGTMEREEIDQHQITRLSQRRRLFVIRHARFLVHQRESISARLIRIRFIHFLYRRKAIPM